MAHLGWPAASRVARRHEHGTSLAIAAPVDQLFTATEVNEWALCATLAAGDAEHTRALEAALLAAALEAAGEGEDVLAPVLEESAALARFTRLSAREARPALRALIAEAERRGLPRLLDDALLSLGAGEGGRDFVLASLPGANEVTWDALHDVPTAVVTGSNGKTTTVRLLAACARAHGWASAYCSTDGVYFDGTRELAGDYAGPEGARRVLREHRAQAALIETARGGILRRGLALTRAHVALVTNVSADHFGEYGIDDLGALADVKLTVAGLVPPDGLLVLNADDPLLLARAPSLARRFGRAPPLGWFALDFDAAPLAAQRARGCACCAVRAGRLLLARDGAEHDLGEVRAMPLTVDGSAAYNIANLAGAALAAAALGVAPAVIAAVCARFGASAADNAGRMMRFRYHGAEVLVDYAHNAEGLRGLLSVATHLRRGAGRLALLLGHAGNRRDQEIEGLAQVAAGFHPSLVVVKENEAHLRGREPGELPRLIHAALLRAGVPQSSLAVCMSELAAVRYALDWARPGDVLALPVHASAAREAVLGLLDA
ncbi:MAG TPA: Mur ligase family protein [Steroidobacteraceae bacterium]|jgi:UDP-N-acetylmuramyl tripeptide synthase|nr:Mur ligase family protein [Steroidobacteraceae bacterium]